MKRSTALSAAVVTLFAGPAAQAAGGSNDSDVVVGRTKRAQGTACEGFPWTAGTFSLRPKVQALGEINNNRVAAPPETMAASVNGIGPAARCSARGKIRTAAPTLAV